MAPSIPLNQAGNPPADTDNPGGVFDLADEQATLLALLLQEAGIADTAEAEPAPPAGQPGFAGAANHSPVPTRNPADLAVLSFAQQRLWFLEQLGSSRMAYTLASSLRLRGPLNQAALHRSLQTIVQRHETLRTTFATHHGEPIQIIAHRLDLAVPLVDLRSLPPDERASEAERRITHATRQPFDLQQGPLLRVLLLRLADEDSILHTTMHHIITDGWSMQVFAHELGTLYAFYSANEHGEASEASALASLPRLPIQYADYAIWQRRELQGTRLHVLLNYWTQQLADSPALLQIPTDYPRPAIQSMDGSRLLWQVPPALLAGLRSLSQQTSTTMYMTLLAAFAVLLMRYSGQTDIPIGSPIANRPRRELEPLIGFFANTLVLRVQAPGAWTFRRLLAHVRQVAIEAYEYQDLPFERLVEARQPERNLSYQPLFQVAFALEQSQTRTPALPGLDVEQHWQETGTVQYDLALLMEETAQGIVGEWQYASALFRPDTIRRMAGHFEVLLRHLVAAPDQPIDLLPMLTPTERQQIVFAWNDTGMDYPRGILAHHLFELQAARAPRALAVVDPQHQLPYDSLNRQANQLAHRLRELGVGPEKLVVLCLERSVTFVVGMLGVLKAGGAYIPLDPTLPVERLRTMIADARAQVIITAPPLTNAFAGQPAAVFCLDHEAPRLASAPQQNPTVPVDKTNLAYVIYTSGSTGTPKGVQLAHAGLTNLIHWYQQAFQVTATDRTTQLAGLGFDATVWELWPALTAGATVHMPDETIRSTPALLRDWLVQQAITLTFVPTPIAEQLLSLDWTQQPCALRVMQTAGDALKRYPTPDLPFALVNNYGPSEDTVATTSGPVPPRADNLPHAPPTIGSPIANHHVYILDRHMHPVPIGVPGELYIGGVGLSRGYLHQPALTAEKFVPDFFSGDPGARLFRTGDRARYLPNGDIEFLGRLDTQVQIRGFRVELGEIEVTVQTHPAVKEVIVLAREHASGSAHLVAYIVPWPDQRPHAAELRSYLQQRLPAYMLPTAFVLLEALPLTPNGKINRQALPDPATLADSSGVEAGVRTAAQATDRPRSALETQLAEIWARVLEGEGSEPVAIDASFFDLGGHSLQAMQLATAVSEATGISISVRDIFLQPTVAGLAAVVQQRQHAAAPAEPTPPVVPVDRGVKAKQSEPPVADHATPGLTIEQRPLLTLFTTRKLPPVEAASLYYLVPAMLEQTSLSREELINEWYDNLPLYDDLTETAHGRIASILLPRFGDQLYNDRADMVDMVLQGLEIAGQLGARMVSLTGLLPSATSYGQDIVATIATHPDRAVLPAITTGHATTTSAVVLSIQRILAVSGRDIRRERVGFLGLGSIGRTSLLLLLKSMPHPHELLLCDVYSKQSDLEALKAELLEQAGFRGSIRLLRVEAGGDLPPAFYTASLIVGATNVPDVLDVALLQPGTLIVDDSGPHCYNEAAAIRRLEQQQDMLFTEGGALQSPQPIHATRYLPRAASRALPEAARAAFFRHNPQQIMGCTLSGLLSSQFEAMPPTVGLVDTPTAWKHYSHLQALGFRGADLHSGGYVPAPEVIAAFREKFGE